MKSNAKVPAGEVNLYAEWRRRSGVVPALREDPPPPPEHLLQLIWFHQRVRRNRLRTVDGRSLQVLHPGFWNREAGPDFREAVLQFEGEAPTTCDVEVDLEASGWTGHRHDRNPNFRNVGLHVVWEPGGGGRLATMALRGLLDAPLAELALWLGTEAAAGFPPALAGKCSEPLRRLPPARVGDLLHQAALIRLQAKASQFGARARQAGWEQALWEGLFRALGYKHNAWPMQRLGELLPRICPEPASLEVRALQARLLGVGGLLPGDMPRAQPGSSQYLRQLWDFWWRERDACLDCILPRTLWRFAGLRPANHPQRRLALAAHWLAAGDLVRRLEKWCGSKPPAAKLLTSLSGILQVSRDDYWSWHWTLRSPRLEQPQMLVGAARVTDFAMNVVLPWLWSRAAEAKHEALMQEMERRYLAWPEGEDNAVLRLARQRLLGGRSSQTVRGAAAQQGLLQIVRDYCHHANAVCDGCQFPELVGQFADGES